MSPKFVDQKHLRHGNGQGGEDSTTPTNGQMQRESSKSKERASKLKTEPEDVIAIYRGTQPKRISTTGASGGRRNYKAGD